ncbi:MAG: helix-turn-helix transcriptional regulator [Chloroflexi bacterium]|nr:helix-turn-helix transcriptional regulator [Chloroflexota bacterium]
MCREHEGEINERHCCPPRRRIRGFVQPWLLLLLLQKPSHGYELMERLAQDEDSPSADPGLLYRTLRQLEEEGLVQSSWDTEGSGPARRLYKVTPEGVEYLHARAVNIRRTRERLDRFLAEYEAYFHGDERR